MSGDRWDREVDVLVFGAGAAGMTAALTSSVEGADVLVCEKSDQVGGTSSTTAGTLWVPGNHHDHPDPDDPARRADLDAAEEYLRGLIADPDVDPELRHRYLDAGRAAVEYVEGHSRARFVACGTHPDYRSEIPGSVASGRAIAPEPFDGRELGDEFRRIRPPIPEFMIFGGLMVGKTDIPRLLNRYRSPRDLSFAAGLFLRYVRDRLRHRRGTRLVMGNALVAQLYRTLLDRNIPVSFGVELVELVRGDDGRVEGALVTEDGTRRRYRARRGVILATGGFGRDPELRARLLPEPTAEYSLTAAPNDGDGVRVGESVGASVRSLGRDRSAFWAPSSIVTARDGSRHAFPHLAMDRAKPGLIAVDERGRRFVDESLSYHDFVNGLYAHAASEGVGPVAHLVVDSTFLRRYGLGIVRPGALSLRRYLRSGYLRRAATLRELARQCGVDPDGLETTVATYNTYDTTGVDPEYGKGSKVLGRFNGDPSHEPNPCIGPIVRAPFYAVRVVPTDLGTSAGLETDVDGRVLDRVGAPIPGLYACGNDMASPMRGAYPGPGVSLGPAVVFGHLAGMHAAGAGA